MKNKKFKIIQILFSVIIFMLIIYQLNIADFKNVKLYFSLVNVAIIFFLLLLALYSRSYRWGYLMNTSSIKIQQTDSFKFLLVGVALNIVMPAGAGDVAKSYFGYKWSGIKERMFSVSLYDKILAISSLFFLAIYSYFKLANYLFIVAGLISIFPLMIILFYDKLMEISLFTRIVSFLERKIKRISFAEILNNLKFSWRKTVFGLFLSTISWIITYFLLYFCFSIVQLNIHWTTVLAMSPFLTLARLFPFTFNGLGSDEFLIVYLFSKNPTMDEAILIGALIYRLILIFLPALFGVIILSLTKKINIKS